MRISKDRGDTQLNEEVKRKTEITMKETEPYKLLKHSRNTVSH